jgi:transcriptional regulator with XRE-family HTH domain
MANIVVSTLAEVAELFGVGAQTVKSWRRDRMPGKPGAYDIGEIIRWKAARTEKHSAQAAIDRKYELQSAKLQEEVDKLRREAKVAEENTLERSVIEATIALFFVTVRDRILNTVPRLRSRMPREHEDKIAAEMSGELRLALTEVSDKMLRFGPSIAKIAELIEQSRSAP